MNNEYLSDDKSDDTKEPKQLAYYRRTKELVNLSIPIDEEFKAPIYYRQVCRAIKDTSPSDTIEFEINSSGGRLDGLVALLAAMNSTEASTQANIFGNCHSAASMLALNCDNITVSPFSTMLVHYISFGTYGKVSDIKKYTSHIDKVAEKLFRDTYLNFLTEEEIEKCLDGHELWLDSDGINQRLQHKYNIANNPDNIQEEVQDKPKRAKRVSKK